MNSVVNKTLLDMIDRNKWIADALKKHLEKMQEDSLSSIGMYLLELLKKTPKCESCNNKFNQTSNKPFILTKYGLSLCSSFCMYVDIINNKYARQSLTKFHRKPSWIVNIALLEMMKINESAYTTIKKYLEEKIQTTDLSLKVTTTKSKSSLVLPSHVERALNSIHQAFNSYLYIFNNCYLFYFDLGFLFFFD